MENFFYDDELNKQLIHQDKLNIETCGDSWKAGITKNDKIIDWRQCLISETNELIDSIGWEHWKNLNKNTNYMNIHVELVDIWHFLLSDLLTIDIENSERVNIIVNAINKASYTINIAPLSKNEKDQHIIKKAKEFIHEVSNETKVITNTDALKKFFILVSACDLDIKKLFALYYGKNYLNTFRQINGYKEGTYNKIWKVSKNESYEDNYFMYNFVLEQSTIPKKEVVLNELQKLYKGFNNEVA